MTSFKKRLCIFVLAASTSASLFAADFPSKNINYVVPFESGGAVDVTARLMADVASNYFDKRKFIVKNMPGGGAVIGQTYVSAAPADGYTLLAMTSSVVNNTFLKSVSYGIDSFTPLAIFNIDPEVIVTASDSELKNIDDFLAAAGKGAISIATPGNSTSHHIAALSLAKERDLKFRYVHNASAAMQLQQIMGDHVQAGFMSLGEAIGPEKSGNIRILAVMDKSRSELAPNVPTYEELTGDDVQWGTFRGIAAPAGLPEQVELELKRRLSDLLHDESFVERMNKSGYQVLYKDGDYFKEYLKNNAEQMKNILPLLEKSS